MNPDYVIYNATQERTKRMIGLMKTLYQKNTDTPDDDYEKLQLYFTKHLASMVKDLILQDIQEYYRLFPPSKKSLKKLRTKNPLNSKTSVDRMQGQSKVSVREANNRFISIVDEALIRVSYIPFILIDEALYNERRANKIMAEEIKKIKAEADGKPSYYKFTTKRRTPQEEFVIAILLAIKALKQKSLEAKKGNQITIKSIAKQMKYKSRSSFYDDCGKHTIKVGKDLNIIDRKTKKPFEFK